MTLDRPGTLLAREEIHTLFAREEIHTLFAREEIHTLFAREAQTLFILWLFHGGAEEEEDELGEVEADDGAQGGQLVLGQGQSTSEKVYKCTSVKSTSVQVYKCTSLQVYLCIIV